MKKWMLCVLAAVASAACMAGVAKPVVAAEPSLPLETITLPETSAPVAESLPAEQAMPAADAWLAERGQSLRTVAQQWARKAGYELVWEADYDFPIAAALRFDGDFLDAMQKLFDAYAAADRPLVVNIYQEQKLVHVQAQG
ncbi:toxin co-regulated pilus biosynthesis Q family protein [Chromobacterium violaceum]|uniref:toxin co-regulated pilus biosynthesis Q family protein n=1 Tax=Chromobacterium violaceum TaxID=536 RepID=UPI00069C5E99|nr:toxin co-regulated pilus biosynthesis Q family protein [Chromobacterium violaceum]